MSRVFRRSRNLDGDEARAESVPKPRPPRMAAEEKQPTRTSSSSPGFGASPAAAQLMRAERLGHHISRLPGSAQVVASRVPAGTIQRAGHPEDLAVLHGRTWLVKRADATETAQYQGFAQNPQTAPPNIPVFHGPFTSLQQVQQALGQLGIQLNQNEQAKVQTMATNLGQRRLFLLSNAVEGSGNASLRDLKLGKHTASGTDQERRGVTGPKKWAKIAQHDVMDKLSGSRERGFRDEDRWKGSKSGDNLDQLRATLSHASDESLQAIDAGLALIEVWLGQTNTVYVGSSILVVVNPDTPADSNATMIDFEHPITTADASFATHRNGMIVGVQNMRQMLEDALAPDMVGGEIELQEI